jgi:hypothetical protein
VNPVRPHAGTAVTLRAALLLLAGVAVFALGLLPAHAATDQAMPSHAPTPTTHANAGHSVAEHATKADHHEGGFDNPPRDAHGLHAKHADEPLCHSAQTSNALICKQVGTTDLTLLFMALLAGGLLAAFVIPWLALEPVRSRATARQRAQPIRRAFGHRLLLLDCVARI